MKKILSLIMCLCIVNGVVFGQAEKIKESDVQCQLDDGISQQFVEDCARGITGRFQKISDLGLSPAKLKELERQQKENRKDENAKRIAKYEYSMLKTCFDGKRCAGDVPSQREIDFCVKDVGNHSQYMFGDMKNFQRTFIDSGLTKKIQTIVEANAKYERKEQTVDVLDQTLKQARAELKDVWSKHDQINQEVNDRLPGATMTDKLTGILKAQTTARKAWRFARLKTGVPAWKFLRNSLCAVGIIPALVGIPGVGIAIGADAVLKKFKASRRVRNVTSTIMLVPLLPEVGSFVAHEMYARAFNDAREEIRTDLRNYHNKLCSFENEMRPEKLNNHDKILLQRIIARDKRVSSFQGYFLPVSWYVNDWHQEVVTRLEKSVFGTVDNDKEVERIIDIAGLY